MFLYYDVETTGLPDFRQPAERHEAHPGVAQLAAVLVDAEAKIRGSMDVIFRQPLEVPVSESATAIHGIGAEQMATCGISPKLAVRMFLELMNRAETLCAHNQRFDQKMMRIEMHRNGYSDQAEALRQKPVHCTMQMADAIMRMDPPNECLPLVLPNQSRPNWKRPTSTLWALRWRMLIMHGQMSWQRFRCIRRFSNNRRGHHERYFPAILPH